MKAVYSGYYTSQGWDKEKLNSIAPTGDIKQFKAEMKRLGLDTKLPVRYKGRLTRLELLYAQMWGNAKVAGAKELALSHANYAALYENSYNLSVYEVSKGLTRTPAFTKLPTTQIEAALRHQFMGKNYSQRIWKNTNDLAAQLQKEVAKTIITGESPQKAAKRLRERYNVAKWKAERLMRTETARFQNEGTAGAGPQALEKLHALNVELEMLRSLLRVAYEVQFMSGKSLGFIIGQIDEVGRMRGGWARHCGGHVDSSS